jgi:transposase
MPTYEITGPDGKTYSIDGPEGATREQVIAAIRRRLGVQQAGSRQAGFVESFKEAATTLKAAPAAAKFAAADTPEEKAATRKALLEQAGGDEFDTTAFADIKDLPGALDWAKQVLGSSAGALAAPALAGVATGPIGGVAALGTQYTTSNLIRQAEEQERAIAEGRQAEETSVGKAIAGAGASTALDVVGFKFFQPLFKSFPLVGKLFGESGEKGAAEAGDKIKQAIENKSLTFKGGVARGIAKGVAFEVPQEIAQTAIERWQAGLPLTGSEANGEYFEASMGALLLGTGLGGASGIASTRENKRKAEEALREKQLADEKAKREAAEAARAAAGEPVSAETAAEKLEPAKIDETLLANAERVVREFGNEVKASDHVNKLVDELGLSIKDAKKTLRELRKNKVISVKDDKNVVNAPEVDVLPYVGKEGETDLEEVVTDETAAQAQAAQQAQQEAAPTGAQAAETATAAGEPAAVETSTAAPTEIATTEGVQPDESVAGIADVTAEPTDVGAGAGGVGVPPSGSVAAGSDLEGTETSGLGAATPAAERLDVGAEASQPALTKKAQAQAEVVQRKEQRKVALNELTVNLDNLTTLLPEDAEQDTVREIAALAKKLGAVYTQFERLPKNKTAALDKKESALDAQIVSIRNRINFLTDLVVEQGKPFKSKAELDAELKTNEAEAQRRAAREDAGGLSATEKAEPFNLQLEAQLRNGVNNAIDFISQDVDQSRSVLLAQPRKQVMQDVKRGKPALAEDITDTIVEAKPAIGGRRVEADEKRQIGIKVSEVLSGLTELLSRVSFQDSAVQIEGDANTDPNVFTRLRQDNRLAEYDPKTNTFYFTRDGLSSKVFLHEAVHAATVKILRAFETAPDSLTPSQRDGAEHMIKIYTEAKKKLGGRFRNEFENVYEFVSGVATDKKLQRELAKISRPNLAKYTKRVTTLWNQFTEALAKMFGIDSRKGTKGRILDENVLPPEVSGTSRLVPGDAGYQGNLLLEASQALQYIISAPEKGVDVAPLPARGRRGKGQRLVAPTQKMTLEEAIAADTVRYKKKYDKPSTVKKLANFFSGQDGYEWLARKFQNDRRPLVWLQEQLRRAGLLKYGGKDANNLYDLIALSSGKAFHNMTQYMQSHFDDVHKAIKDYANAKGIDVDTALIRLSRYLTARHEPERRHVKYLMNVPLNNTTKVRSAVLGVEGTPAMLREFILRELHKPQDLVSNGKAKQYRQVLEQLVQKYKDKDGVSTTKAKPGSMSLDENAPEYTVLGTLDKELIAETMRDFEADQANEATAASMKQLLDALEVIKENSKMLDREANYWSPPVDNIVNFYGYQYYVPFKGKPPKETDVSEGDERFEIGGPRLGGELSEAAQAAEGRISDSENVILQLLSDGTKSTMRAGRSGVTQAIKNLIQDGYIRGSKSPKVVKFEDRYKGFDPSELRGENKIFHHTPEGNIEVFTINDNVMRDAIRRAYQTPSPFIEFANKITSGIGHFHTRYNPAFYPYNFVRDALTNAFTMSSEMGPKAAFDYIGAVAVQVGKMGLVKTGRVAKMYAEGRVSEIEAMAKKDPDVANILEYLEEGGRTTYIQGLSLESQKEELAKSIGNQKYARTSEQINKWVDIWADSFEFTSRAAAYSVAKSNAMARGATEAEARQEAAAYAKNLANFEQVGEYGRTAGALFMFFRPAATGAVRAFDSMAPLFQNLEAAEARLPPGIRENPEAMAKFRENFIRQQDMARATVYGLLGAGATLYLMAYMASDDDELGRNKVETDDMALWTRNLRLPLGIIGKEGFLQLPWGFGLGAFGAAGAQVAGAAFGKTSMKDMAVNMTNVALDSFMPLPVSRIDPTENFPAWIVDSIVPSAARPFVEFAMNVDGLGREIYNNRATKYGEAYTGGKNVPELYKTMAQGMFEFTNGDIKVQPNTLYFWTNNYLDGISRIAHSAYGIGLTAAGDKDFDAKTDLVLFSSFVGRKSNYDGREFAQVEKKIEDKADTLRSLENTAKLTGDVESLRRYYERFPNDKAIIYIYNKQKNNRLRNLQEIRNAVDSNKNYTPKQKKEIIDQIDLERNYIKRGLIETFRQYGVNP